MKATLITVCTDAALNFKGNTAGVILLENPVDGKEMQRIAKELNQPATTFLWAVADEENTYNVRWFAPDAEISLCGHGSLAAFAFLKNNGNSEVEWEATLDEHVEHKMVLKYEGGEIIGNATKDFTEMHLNGISIIKKLSIPQELKEGLGIEILNYYETDNKNIVLVKNEWAVANMQPDFAKLRELETFGYTVTSQGDKVDFVSRTLVPHVQQLEDHATGSSHAALTPFWSKRLDKTEMVAHQLSPNGGKFWCGIKGGLVSLKAEYIIGEVVDVAE